MRKILLLLILQLIVAVSGIVLAQSKTSSQSNSSGSGKSSADSAGLISNIPTALQEINGLLDKQSLNRQNVLTNFLQIVGSNLTSSGNQSLQLQGNLFALNFFKDSAQKYSDPYYLKWGANALRNTQLSLGGGFTSNNQLNSFTSGLTFNVLNLRDSSLVLAYYRALDAIGAANLQRLLTITGQVMMGYEAFKEPLVKQEIGTYLTSAVRNIAVLFPDTLKKSNLIRNAISNVRTAAAKDKNHDSTGIAIINAGMDTLALNVKKWRTISDSVQRNKSMDTFQSSEWYTGFVRNLTYAGYTTVMDDSLHAYWDTVYYTQKVPNLKGSTEFYTVVDSFNTKIKRDSAFFHVSDLAHVYLYYRHVADSVQKQISRRPLLQAGLNFGYSSSGISHMLMPNLQYMQGFSLSRTRNMPVELSVSIADSMYTDTSTKNNTFDRNVGMFKGSFDITFFTDQSGQSLLEAELGPEYDHVYNGHYSGEKWDKYYAVLELLGRPSSKSPWLTLTFKYDMKQGNFLGFLNLTFALSNSSNSK